MLAHPKSDVPPDLDFDEEALAEIHSRYGLREETARRRILDAVTGAKRRIHAGHARLIDINWNRERDMKAAAWNKDALLVRFFGDDMTPARLTRVSYLMERFWRAGVRVRTGALRIRILPQPKVRYGEYARVQNDGGGFSPNTFKLYPRWFEAARSPVVAQPADFIVRAVFEGMFVVTTKRVQGHWVSGETQAVQLAKRCALTAARSPANFAWYSRRAFEDDAWIRRHLGSRSMLE